MRGRKQTNSIIGLSLAGLIGALLFTTTHTNTDHAHDRHTARDTTAASQHNVAATGTQSGTATHATQQLAQLHPHRPGNMRDYDRDQFGDGWNSQGHGCTTRDVVLQQQGQHVQTNSNCTITSGQWTSLYDGKPITNPHQLDIDHLVPEAEAWRSGAKQWNQHKREKFANDYRSGELVAVTQHANRSKSDAPPPGYMPKTQQCSYARRWISVKHKWGLTVTTSERDGLTRMLHTC